MFGWKPIYIELAQKLLAYRDKQEQLLTWLQEMRQTAIPAISVTDFGSSAYGFRTFRGQVRLGSNVGHSHRCSPGASSFTTASPDD